MSQSITKYPLQWPETWARTKWPETAKFGSHSFTEARDELFRQVELLLDYWDHKSIVLSTNVPLRNDGIPYANMRQPDDKGVAVYFQYKKEATVLCCDKWNRIEHNLWALAKTIEALRGVERWGVSDFLKRSFTGFAELPPAAEKQAWWRILGFAGIPLSYESVKTNYREIVKSAHPDAGGTTQWFQSVQEAYEQGKKHFGI